MLLPRRRHKRGYVETEASAWRLLELEAEAEARLRRIRQRLLRAREGQRRDVEPHEQLVLELTA